MRSGSYVWRDPSGKQTVYLALDVVDRLAFEAFEAYKSIPHRGLEIGGLLLGRVERREDAGDIYISDYATIDSEHRSGPSYHLSESDLTLFEEAVKRQTEVSGLYRTQTRSESLELHGADIRLLRTYCKSADALFLLIRPQGADGGAAALFLFRDGELRHVHKFPFKASELEVQRDGHPAIHPAPADPKPPGKVVESPQPSLDRPEGRPEKPDPAPQAAESAIARRTVPKPPAREVLRPAVDALSVPIITPPRAEPPAPAPSRRADYRWLAPAATIAAGMIVGAGIYHVGQMRERVAVPSPPATHAPEHVALNVERDGQNLRFLWDRNAPVVRAANRGVIYITDGSRQSTLDLDHAQLSSGLLSYQPESQDVTFRLDVFNGSDRTDDVIRIFAPPGPPPQQPRAANASAAARAKPEATNSADEAADRNEGTDSRPSAFDPPPKPAVAPAPAIPSQPAPPPIKPEEPPEAVARPSARTPGPQVSVSVEPVHGSGVGGVIGHVPLLRRLKKRQALLPPAPLHEFKPALTEKERRELTQPFTVDVKVQITDTGKVEFAEIASKHSGLESEIAVAALFAARKWDFEPAILDGRNAPAELVLQFHFTPAGKTGDRTTASTFQRP